MSKIQDHFSANGRSLFEYEKPVVDAFNDKYRHSLREVASKWVLDVSRAIDQNKECFVAIWMLQGSEARIEDYTLCTQTDWRGDEACQKFWMEKK